MSEVPFQKSKNWYLSNSYKIYRFFWMMAYAWVKVKLGLCFAAYRIRVLSGDIPLFAIIYLIVILGFTAAIKTSIGGGYFDLAFQLFELSVGQGESFADQNLTGWEKTHARWLFICYMVVSVVTLLNLLIAVLVCIWQRSSW